MSNKETTASPDNYGSDMVAPRPINVSRPLIEKFAEEIARDHLKISYADDIQYAVVNAGGKIVIGTMDNNTHDSGSLVAKSYNDFTIYLSPFTSLVRDRFTIAHELGHLYLHLDEAQKTSPSSPMYATRYVDRNDPDAMRAEWEANWFAAALLMPREKFIEVYKNTGKDLGETADFFKVSQAAASVRAKSLNL